MTKSGVSGLCLPFLTQQITTKPPLSHSLLPLPDLLWEGQPAAALGAGQRLCLLGTVLSEWPLLPAGLDRASWAAVPSLRVSWWPQASPIWGSLGAHRSPGAGGHMVWGPRSAGSLETLIIWWWLSPPEGGRRGNTSSPGLLIQALL